MSSRTFFFCLILAFPPIVRGATPEPWADAALKPPNGLMLWLDASAQNAARRMHGRPELADGARFDVGYDASGHRLHLIQHRQESQPRYHSAGGRAVLRFDGVDDALTRTGLGRELQEATVILVAAPRSNAGLFRAFLAFSETGKNDYTTGLTLDMSGHASDRFRLLNVEGRGFGGAVNLMRSDLAFGEFHTLEARANKAARRVEFVVDGVPSNGRPWDIATLRMDELFVGARCYSNSAEPPHLTGFLEGDIAEVLVFDRALTAGESQAIHAYLAKKHAGLAQTLATRGRGKPLRSVVDPPPVQVFVPGFHVRQLPIDLPNVNNVKYRHDGKLVALTYDGDVYLLRDTNGDGVEDRADLFWDNKGRIRAPIGMALTTPGSRHGNGLLIANKGKVSLIVDRDGDDKADQEIVVAQGWKELSHGVDALGVAVGQDGAIYFGLGAADFTNAYLLDKGQTRYDVKSERGTILKVSPDFSRREIVATGIRFPVALAHNRHGDLFATDQEGATWLSNGNPFDELLHILPGRHYGFPPRHPRHLPDVIDEPSVFDYVPQHQSTCGLSFNESLNGGPVFGPPSWTSDALVTGYSRGKLYRTRLAKTSTGYVAQNHLFASLNMLTVDACVSPRGHLTVATHSGAPDWGTGPSGRGRLYQISYDRNTPLPVVAWAAGPQEVHVAFDRPLDADTLQGVAKQATIEYGLHVSPGDRFEALRPGYAVVQHQRAEPRFDLPIHTVQISADRRTLILTTSPHPESVPYALTLPSPGSHHAPREAPMTLPSLVRPPQSNPRPGELPQLPVIDLAYDLCGVSATWEPTGGGQGWSGWLPHPDLDVARHLTVGSAEHEAFWPLLLRPGRLTLRTQVDLFHLLRPAVQPGSTLDHTPPPEQVTLTANASVPLRANGSLPTERTAKWSLTPQERRPLTLDLELTTGGASPTLNISFVTQEDARPRALPLRRFLLPWATLQRRETVARAEFPQLQGGSWLRGRELFHSSEARCASCHAVRGQGGKIGPDLTNLIHRDYDSVLRDIRTPSAAINPDYLTSLVELRNGRILTGVVRSEGDRLILGGSDGKETSLLRSHVASQTAAPLSQMPEGLDIALGPQKMRDLLTYLLTEPLSPAPLERDGAPPARAATEIAAILQGRSAADTTRRLHIVLAGGPKDHGPGEHDYPLFQRRWFSLLSLADNVRLSTSPGWPSPELMAKADVVVFYSNNPGWSEARAKELDTFLERGGGAVFIHYAVDGHRDAEALAARIGLAWRGGSSRFRHGALDLDFVGKHPIAEGFRRLNLIDESYWNLVGDVKRVTVLAAGREEGTAQPLVWVREQGKGRVFVSIPGHYTWTFDDPLFRLLLLRGIAWTARESVDRFAPLATLGAR